MGDGIFRHRKHDHLVVGEEPLFHGAPEADLVQGGAVQRLILHGAQRSVHFTRLVARRRGIYLRRSGHVQPAMCPDMRLVVDLYKVAVFFTLDACARCPVGLITDGQVKVRQPMNPLSFANHGKRVVRGKYHRKIIGCVWGSFLRQLGRIRRCRKGQIQRVHVDVVVVAATTPANLHIRACCVRPERKPRIRGPLAHRLGHEGQTGHQVQHAATASRKVLRNAKRRKRLARSACHDELATGAFVCKAGHSLAYGLFLVWTRRLGLRARDLFGLYELRPVNRTLTKLVQPNASHRDRMLAQKRIGVAAPVLSRRINDQAARNARRKSRQKLRYVSLLQPLAFGPELALDRTPAFAASDLGDQVDAQVCFRQVPRPGPLPVVHGGLILGLLRRIMREKGFA